MATTMPSAEAQAKAKRNTKQRTLSLIKSLDPDDDERTAISKKISWILRHGAKAANVRMDDDGWVKTSDLCKAEILDDIAMETLMQVIIDSNGKKLRYELKESKEGQLIKAYSKKERKAKESASGVAGEKPNKALDGKSLREEAPAFVPNATAPAVPASPSAAVPGAGAAGAGYPGYPGYPWGYGYPPMMPFVQNPYFPWAAGMQGQVPAGKCSGRIKSFNSEKGFGFIECAQTYAQYNRDVFLHKAQIGDMSVGTWVTFTCEVSKQGMPQAKDVVPLMGAAPAGGKGGKSKGKGKEKGKGGEGKGKGKDKDKEKKSKGKKEKKDGEAAEGGEEGQKTEEKKEEKAEEKA